MAYAVDATLGGLTKALIGVVVGAAGVMLFNENDQQKFGVGAAALAVVSLAVYARRMRGCPGPRGLLWVSLVLAVVATVVAAFGPVEVRGYALLGAGFLTILAALAAEHFESSFRTLAGVALIGAAVALIGVAVGALVEGETLYGVAGIGVGVGVAAVGLGILVEGVTQIGVGVTGFAVAMIGVGVAVVVDGETLFGVAVIGFGVAMTGFAIGLFVGSENLLGVAFVGVGVQYRDGGRWPWRGANHVWGRVHRGRGRDDRNRDRDHY